MDNLLSNELLLESLVNILEEDYYKFLKSIYLKYGDLGGFTYKDLLQKYPFSKIKILKPKKKIIIKHKVANKEHRCVARVWGGENSVYFNRDISTWNYGHQCTRTFSNNETKLCQIHQHQLDTNMCLTHGTILEDPPHNHYLKYKHSYSIINNIE